MPGGWSARAVLTILAALTIGSALAQEPSPGQTGVIDLSDTSLVIREGENLTIGPNASITGSGSIEVWGELTIRGDPASAVDVSVPIRILDGGRVTLVDTRLWAINGTAVEVRGGSLTLADVLFEGNKRAVLVSGEGVFRGERATFRNHPGEAIYLENAADVTLEGATLSENGRGATIYSARRFHVSDSRFSDNDQHVVIDLGPSSHANADVLLARNEFLAPTATRHRLAAISLAHDAPPSTPEQRVRLDSNRVEGAATGLRAEGRGLHVESRNDSFVGNQIGVSVQLARVHLQDATLRNAENLAGVGFELSGQTSLAPFDAAPPAPAPRTTWVPWAIGLGALVAVGGGAIALRRPPSPPPAPTRAPYDTGQTDTPASPEPRAARLAAPISALERRILEDIVAHPGTPQRAVAERLGYTRQALHYHVKKLEARGLIEKTIEGRETHCRVPAEIVSLLDARAENDSEPAPAETRTESHEKA